jgi:hypothetical protein
MLPTISSVVIDLMFSSLPFWERHFQHLESELPGPEDDSSLV